MINVSGNHTARSDFGETPESRVFGEEAARADGGAAK